MLTLWCLLDKQLLINVIGFLKNPQAKSSLWLSVSNFLERSINIAPMLHPLSKTISIFQAFLTKSVGYYVFSKSAQSMRKPRLHVAIYLFIGSFLKSF